MLESNILFLILFIGLGAMIQTVTGFAMGLVIIGGVTLFGLADIAFIAIIISLISGVNTLIALRYAYKHIKWIFVAKVSVTMLPALVLGVLVLDYLSNDYYVGLQKLLGLVIVTGGILLMLRPTPWNKISHPAWLMLTGTAGGFIGGMYSAGGAPLAYFMYRQPLEINVIRATLLCFFALTTALRTVVVGIQGQLTTEILSVFVLAVPVVIIVTLTMTRLLHLVPDGLVRKLVFLLLVAMGIMLIAK